MIRLSLCFVISLCCMEVFAANCPEYLNKAARDHYLFKLAPDRPKKNFESQELREFLKEGHLKRVYGLNEDEVLIEAFSLNQNGRSVYLFTPKDQDQKPFLINMYSDKHAMVNALQVMIILKETSEFLNLKLNVPKVKSVSSLAFGLEYIPGVSLEDLAMKNELTLGLNPKDSIVKQLQAEMLKLQQYFLSSSFQDRTNGRFFVQATDDVDSIVNFNGYFYFPNADLTTTAVSLFFQSRSFIVDENFNLWLTGPQ